MLRALKEQIIAQTASAMDVAIMVTEFGTKVEYAMEPKEAQAAIESVATQPEPEPETEPVPWSERHEGTEDNRPDDAEPQTKDWLDEIGDEYAAKPGAV